MQDLATEVIPGFTDTRPVWWLRYAEAEGYAPTTFPGAIPLDVVNHHLTSWLPELDDMVAKSTLIRAIGSGLTGDDLLRAIETMTVEEGRLVRTPKRQAIIGPDTPLHSYGDWLYGTVKEVIGDEVQVSSVGLLKGRMQAWVQVERPETAKLAGNVEMSPFVLLSGSLDNSLAHQMNQSFTNTICDNTMQFGRTQGISFRKTKNSDAKLGAYRSVLSAIMQGITDFSDTLDSLLEAEVSAKRFSNFIEAYIPIDDDASPKKRSRRERVRQEITSLYNSDDRVAQWKGTEWGVVQAVSTWNQHMSQLMDTSGEYKDDTNLRAMRNYQWRVTPPAPKVPEGFGAMPKGSSQDDVTRKVLAAV